MTLLPKLDAGWELELLALTYPDGRVQGSVRANKLLADLQREGFPTAMRFKNIEMGPASLDLAPSAKDAEEHGRLRLEKVPMEQEGVDPRTDFVLTDAGAAHVHDVVFPALNDHPRAEVFREVLSRFLHESRFEKTVDLIERSHETLMLDNPLQLSAVRDETLDKLSTHLGKIREGPRARTNFDILVGATVELAHEALTAALPKFKDPSDQWTGKNNILSKCVDLVGLLDDLERFRRLPRMPKTLEREFELVLNALEVNCEAYGILDLPSDAEIERMLREVEPLDLDRGHE